MGKFDGVFTFGGGQKIDSKKITPASPNIGVEGLITSAMGELKKEVDQTRKKLDGYIEDQKNELITLQEHIIDDTKTKIVSTRDGLYSRLIITSLPSLVFIEKLCRSFFFRFLNIFGRWYDINQDGDVILIHRQSNSYSYLDPIDKFFTDEVYRITLYDKYAGMNISKMIRDIINDDFCRWSDIS